MKSRIIALTIAAFIALPAALFSQGGVSLGLGGMTAVSRGVESLYWNPANLSFNDTNRPNFEMVLYSVFANGGNNSFSFNDINKYIGDGESIFLTEEDINDILNLIPKSGMVFDFNGRISIFSFAYKNIGFGIEAQTFGHFSVPKDLYENLLFRIGRDVYDYSVSGGGQGIVKYKVSYGRGLFERLIFEVPGLKNTIFEKISWGASLAFVQGIGYANIEKGMAKLSISEDGILPKAEFSARKAELGKGMSFDFGLGAYTNNNWKIGLVFENLLGSIFWNGNPELARSTIDFGDDPLFIFGDNQLSDINTDTVITDTTYSLSGFSKRLPLNIRFGLAKNINRYLINMEYNYTDGISQVSLGGGARFSILRCYASVGRRLSNFQWNAGIAFDFKRFYIDFGMSSRGGMTLGSSRALSFGTSMRFGF